MITASDWPSNGWITSQVGLNQSDSANHVRLIIARPSSPRLVVRVMRHSAGKERGNPITVFQPPVFCSVPT